jgi:heptosyltransferase-2
MANRHLPPADPARRHVPDPIRRILVRANNWIGDVVMISPAMRSLRRRFPDAAITILAKPWVLDALRGSPLFDRLMPYERDGCHRGAGGFLRMAVELRRERFDCAVLFQNAFEAALLTALARIPIRVGFDTDARRLLLTHPVTRPPAFPIRHRGEEFLDLVELLGCRRDPDSPEFPVVGPDPGSPAPAGPRVALHPGASKPARTWHPERFAEVGAALQRDSGAEIALLGSPGEVDLLDAIGRRLLHPPLPMPSPPTVRNMALFMRTCHLFIGNDSGPMHMAAALGIPVIGLFGPSATARTSPFRPRAEFRSVTADYPCAPCRQRFFLECDPSPAGRPPCLEAIAVGEVLEAAMSLLAPAPGGQSGLT